MKFLAALLIGALSVSAVYAYAWLFARFTIPVMILTVATFVYLVGG